MATTYSRHQPDRQQGEIHAIMGQTFRKIHLAKVLAGIRSTSNPGRDPYEGRNLLELAPMNAPAKHFHGFSVSDRSTGRFDAQFLR